MDKDNVLSQLGDMIDKYNSILDSMRSLSKEELEMFERANYYNLEYASDLRMAIGKFTRQVDLASASLQSIIARRNQ